MSRSRFIDADRLYDFFEPVNVLSSLFSSLLYTETLENVPYRLTKPPYDSTGHRTKAERLLDVIVMHLI